MKYVWLILAALILWGPSATAQSQNKKYVKKIRKWQKSEDRKFKNPRTSPLRENFRSFHGQDYFPIDEKYRVEATLTLTPEAEPFELATSSGKNKRFVKWAIAAFEIDGKSLELSLYRNLGLKDKKYADYLFLPFTDLTTGEETYGGGRYIETHMPKEGDKLVIDFNRAFNPYCAYSATGWSCPIPPEENFLDIRLEAGAKGYDKE